MTEGVSVGICDDVLLWREEITDKVLAYQTEKQIQITIKQYSCAEDYLKAQDDIDILFLDIEMSGMSGIALKDILIQNKRKEMIAFITCYDGYIREAFGKNVCGFIDKPVSREKVFEVLDKAVEEKKENAVCRLTAETGFSLKEIQYIKSNDKYIEIYTENGVVPGYISLKECEDILPVQTFIRVSRFYIVNFAAIKNIAGTIEMNDGQKIKVSRGKLKEIQRQYADYLMEIRFPYI